MYREVDKVDESHDRMTFVMQSVEERDQYQRTFPDPMPHGFKLQYRWADMHLVFEVVPDTNAGPAPVNPAAQFDGKKTADLITIGAELGLQLRSNMSRARMVGEILRAKKDLAAGAGVN